MRKLLRANVSRLLRDRAFWLLSALMAFFGVSMAVVNAVHARQDGEIWTMDYTLFIYVILAPILASVFTALFIGNEHASGAMRNKLIAGHRRGCIYLADLLVSCCAGICLCLAFALPQAGLGLLLKGEWKAAPAELALYIGLSFALMLAFTALFTLIAMLCQNKAHTTAGCILLTFALLFAGVYISSTLEEPEYLAAYSYTENGVTVEEPEQKNPYYISGVKRQVYEFLLDLTPGGQVIQISEMGAKKPVMLAVYDGLILLLVTGFGLVLFRRENLK